MTVLLSCHVQSFVMIGSQQLCYAYSWNLNREIYDSLVRWASRPVRIVTNAPVTYQETISVGTQTGKWRSYAMIYLCSHAWRLQARISQLRKAYKMTQYVIISLRKLISIMTNICIRILILLTADSVPCRSCCIQTKNYDNCHALTWCA